MGLGVFCCVHAGRGVCISLQAPLSPGGLTRPLSQIPTVILTQQHSGHCPAWAGGARRAGPAKYLSSGRARGPSPGQSAFPHALAGSSSCPPPGQETEALAPVSCRALTLSPGTEAGGDLTSLLHRGGAARTWPGAQGGPLLPNFLPGSGQAGPTAPSLSWHFGGSSWVPTTEAWSTL